LVPLAEVHSIFKENGFGVGLYYQTAIHHIKDKRFKCDVGSVKIDVIHAQTAIIYIYPANIPLSIFYDDDNMS
jgi:hypothetical protein